MSDTPETGLRTGGTQGTGSTLIPRGFFNPKNLAEAMVLAKELAKSDIVPQSFKGKPENILVAIGMGTEVGLSPFQALQSIYVVNGRPSLWGDAIPAIIYASGICEYFEESYDPKTQVATCKTKRKGNPVEIVRSFGIDDAKRAGLWGKAGPWQTFPARMLQMRARGFCSRDAYADLLRGLQIVEEQQDIVNTSAEPLDDVPMRRSEIAASVGEAAASAPRSPDLISDAERKELADLMVDKGLTPDTMRKRLKDKYGIETSSQLPKAKLAELKSWMINGDEPEGV